MVLSLQNFDSFTDSQCLQVEMLGVVEARVEEAVVVEAAVPSMKAVSLSQIRFRQLSLRMIHKARKFRH